MGPGSKALTRLGLKLKYSLLLYFGLKHLPALFLLSKACRVRVHTCCRERRQGNDDYQLSRDPTSNEMIKKYSCLGNKLDFFDEVLVCDKFNHFLC